MNSIIGLRRVGVSGANFSIDESCRLAIMVDHGSKSPLFDIFGWWSAKLQKVIFLWQAPVEIHRVARIAMDLEISIKTNAGPTKLDRIDTNARSSLMQRIRGRDTAPELLVRHALHRAGLRFRVQARDLPGRPDIINRHRSYAVFVHGCFWHGHTGCRYAAKPKTRAAFWASKLEANRQRDQKALDALGLLGFRTAVIWECSLRTEKSAAHATRRLVEFINGQATRLEITSD